MRHMQSVTKTAGPGRPAMASLLAAQQKAIVIGAIAGALGAMGEATAIWVGLIEKD